MKNSYSLATPLFRTIKTNIIRSHSGCCRNLSSTGLLLHLKLFLENRRGDAADEGLPTDPCGDDLNAS